MPEWDVYIGGVTAEAWYHFPRPSPDTVIPSWGVSHLVYDDMIGSFELAGTAGSDLLSPQFLTFHPARHVLYTSEFAQHGRFVSFELQDGGAPVQSSTVASGGTMGISIALHPNGRYAYVVHLTDGILAVCSLDESGQVVDTVATLAPGGLGGRAPGSQLHHVLVTPTGDRLVVADFGLDAVYVYALSDDGAYVSELVARIDFPAGSRPRHLHLHPLGHVMYVACEGDARLYVLEALDFVPQRVLCSHSLVPGGYEGPASASELQLHPDGSPLFVGVRKADIVTAFDVGATGELKVAYYEPCLGRSPRSIAVDPPGRHLIVANWHTNALVVFEIDERRRLGSPRDPFHIPSPSSIVFRKRG